VFYINFNVNKSREDLAFFRKRCYNNSENVYYIYGFVVITITVGKIIFTVLSYTIYDQTVL